MDNHIFLCYEDLLIFNSRVNVLCACPLIRTSTSKVTFHVKASHQKPFIRIQPCWNLRQQTFKDICVCFPCNDNKSSELNLHYWLIFSSSSFPHWQNGPFYTLTKPDPSPGSNLYPQITFRGCKCRQAANVSAWRLDLIDSTLLLGGIMPAHTNWWSGSGASGTADLLAKHSAE